MKEVTFIIAYLGIGGAERVISVLANEFVKSGIKVNIITTNSPEVVYDLDKRINYIYLGIDGSNRIINIFKRILRLRKTLNSIRGKKVIVFLHKPIILTVLATIFTDKELYFSERNNPYMEPTSKFQRFIRDLAYNFGKKIIFQTKDARNYFKESIRKKGYIIPNPIKTDLPKPFIGERKKTIVSVCRLNQQKNIKMLIDAYALLEKLHPEYNVIIYGEGELRKELEEYIIKLGLKDKIELPGFEKEVHNKIINCYMYVSSSNYEGISNSMIESLAIGLPTIVTDCPIGGARATIKNGENGVLVKVGDVKGLYEAMKNVIEDKEFAKKISKNSIKINDDLNPKNISNMWLKVIELE
ncbi:glycosyltransferase [Clostridium perfringens]|uniref:glycosyltransferase n=1 Tax=Clostridium perfringens TaxID=1502 RepID=UPI002148F0BA|nr:glycosyltransferase [Clostridium perfringens]MDM0818956.1 glycosyltransferase [Clostridium perfringens]UUR81531.1 glycosyltransferase [Clostridium perfringens]